MTNPVSVKICGLATMDDVRACADAARALIEELGLDLSVAVVLGDDLADRAAAFAASGVTEMFSGEAFPDPDNIARNLNNIFSL